MVNSFHEKDRNCEDRLLIIEKSRHLDTRNRSSAFLLVTTALLINFFSVGFGFCLSVLYPEFTRVFDSDRSLTALIQSLYVSFILGGAIIWNHFMIRYGPGICIVSGTCICTVGVFLSYFSVNVWMVLVFISFIAGMGGSIAAIGPFVLINEIMGRWKHAALAMIPTGASLGQFGFTYLIEILTEEYNWNGALLIMSGIVANMIPCALIIYFIDRDNRKYTKRLLTSKPKLFDCVVFKEWRYYLLLINSLLLTFSGFVETKFLVDFMILKGFERSVGSEFVSYIGLANFVGRIVGTALKIVYKKGNSLLQLSFLTLLNGCSHAIILFNSSYTGILSGALLNGLTFGLCVPNLPLIMLEIFTVDLYGPALSIWNISGGVGSFLGGYFGGYIEDVTNNYDILFKLAIIFSVIISVFFMITGVSVAKYCKRKGIEYSEI